MVVTTSFGVRKYFTDDNGLFSLDLADIGYVSGETITILAKDKFNNETKTLKVEVTGFFAEVALNLNLRTVVENISELQLQNVLHSVGKKPITADNPLPIFDETDPLAGYMLAGGDDNNQTYGYVNKEGAWYIQKFSSADKTYVYARGSNNFLTNWNARTSLTFKLPNEVF